MSRKFFGTDGIRGRVGSHPITADFMLRLGWAAGQVLAREGHGQVIIGKDTRLSGYMFESALEAGLSSAGINIMLLGPMPTPAVAYLTQTLHVDAGIVISASHNPYHDNGIKFFNGDGYKLADTLEIEIEALLASEMTMVASDRLGKAQRLVDAPGRYIEFCKSHFPHRRTLRGMKIVIDCANGAAYQVSPAVLRELGAEVEAIGISPDGTNINLNCGSTHLEQLTQRVIASGADLGIALDGDADRVLMVDHLGEVVDGDELLFIMARHRHAREPIAGVVGTLMTNFGMELALRDLGIDLARAAVGDRYVLELMQQRGWNLGGEASGHLIDLDCTTTGDGTISALLVLAAMVESGQPLHQLKQGMRKFPQKMINIPLPRKVALHELPSVATAVAAAEARLAGRGRVVLRPSGTESLMRVMVEGEEGALVAELSTSIAEVVKRDVASITAA
jgi:phosphoglucosamine mutase